MYRIAIVDDELIWLREMEKNIRSAMRELEIEDYELRTFQFPLDLSAELHINRHFDLIFLDISFAGGATTLEQTHPLREGLENGLAMASYIRRNYPETRVALVSSHREYVFDGYEVEASYFFVKPPDYNKLKTLLRKDYFKNFAPQKIHLRYTDGSNVFVSVRDIQGVEQYYSKTYVYIDNKRAQVSTSFKQLEEQLPSPPFSRVHQSYIVNFEHVVGMERYKAILNESLNFPISKKNYVAIRESFDHFMLSKVMP